MTKAKVAPLPEVAAPSLGDFLIEVEAPPPIDEQQFNEALTEILRERGEITVRGPGDPITAEDEVLVDMIAYADGKVVALGAKPQVWMLPGDDSILPGARSLLNGRKSGESVTADVRFPESYLYAPLAGQSLRYEIRIRAARKVVPPALEDPSLLASFKVETAEQMFEAIYDGLEQNRVAELDNRVNFAIFDELQHRLGHVEIPDEILDAELSARWMAIEGTFLAEQGVSRSDQEHARTEFVRNEGIRAELAHGLRITMALAAIAREHQLRPTKAQIAASLDRFAPDVQLSAAELQARIKQEPADHAALGSSLLLECAAQFVLEKAKVEVKDSLDG